MYGDITVPMIMQLDHSSVTLTGFVKHKKEIFSQKLHSFLDESCRKKNGTRVEEDWKSMTGNLSTDLPPPV